MDCHSLVLNSMAVHLPVLRPALPDFQSDSPYLTCHQARQTAQQRRLRLRSPGSGAAGSGPAASCPMPGTMQRSWAALQRVMEVVPQQSR